MNTNIFRRDMIAAEDAAMQRALALQDGISQLRRAASAVLAAASGEPNQLRCDALHVEHRALLSILARLQALA
jgi:hypothetical protein